MSSGLGDVSLTIRQCSDLLAKLKASYAKGRDDECMETIAKMKSLVIFLPSFMEPAAESPTRLQEISVSRDFLEYAAMTAVRARDLEQFQSIFAQLQPYYVDLRPVPGLEPSERRLIMLGLHLLSLLVGQRIAAFHAELDRIPYAEHDSVYIKAPIKFERYLMEGSFRILLGARNKDVPCNEYMPLIEMLEDTVREGIAQCIPLTYKHLPVTAAQKMLMFKTEQDARALGAQRGWPLDPTETTFEFPGADDADARKELPFKALLAENLGFAAQLQRVV